MSLYFQGWSTYFLGWGAVPAPSSNIPQGGAGYPVYGRRPILKRLDDVVAEWMDADVKAMYATLIQEAPKAVKREVGKIVRPLSAKPSVKVPPVESVDWAAVQADADRVMKILRIWQAREEDQAEEELFFMVH